MLKIDVHAINERYIKEILEVIKGENRLIEVAEPYVGCIKDFYNNTILPNYISLSGEYTSVTCEFDTVQIPARQKPSPVPESINKDNTLDELIKLVEGLNDTAELSFLRGYITATLWEKEQNKSKEE